MGKIIALTNQKGGVGKTSTTLGLAGALRKLGRSVLTVDCDPQCNTSKSFGIRDTHGLATIGDIYDENAGVGECIYETERGDILPNDKELRDKEAAYAVVPINVYILKKALDEVKEYYDYIIIDTPPNAGFYMTSAIIASDGVIIPLEAEIFSIDGLGAMLEYIERAKYFNPSCQIYGALLNGVDRRFSQHIEIQNQLHSEGEKVGLHVFDSEIRTCQDISNAQGKNEDLFDNKKYRYSNAVADYMAVAEELEGMIHERE
mgnify:CR=1 FL=1